MITFSERYIGERAVRQVGIDDSNFGRQSVASIIRLFGHLRA